MYCVIIAPFGSTELPAIVPTSPCHYCILMKLHLSVTIAPVNDFHARTCVAILAAVFSIRWQKITKPVWNTLTVSNIEDVRWKASSTNSGFPNEWVHHIIFVQKRHVPYAERWTMTSNINKEFRKMHTVDVVQVHWFNFWIEKINLTFIQCSYFPYRLTGQSDAF